MTADASTRRAWPGNGRDGGLRMRESPAAATICRPLTMPSRQPNAANTQTMPAVMT